MSTDELMHIGTPRHSGRYPWGSGDNPYQSAGSFLGAVDELRKKGLTDAEIAKGLGMTRNQLQARKAVAKREQRASEEAQALQLREKGYGYTEIGRIMNKNESSVRNLLNKSERQKADILMNTADVLRKNVEEKDYIDVGLGTNLQFPLGVSDTTLKSAIEVLKDEGYTLHNIYVQQLGMPPGNYTEIKVLAKPGVSKSEVNQNRSQIRQIEERTYDSGRTFLGLEPITNISSNRIAIKYGEDGGADMDGIIQLRRGVDELSLGANRYAQVRIGVDGTHFLKGMAVYSDDMPKGIDIVYNTPKPKGTPKTEVFKSNKDDPDNLFGSNVVQNFYTDANGVRKVSALNIVGYKDGNVEGTWGEWSKNLSSQFLSKQSTSLAEKQLDLAVNKRKTEFDEIMSLTNPAVKKKLLLGFSESADSDAVDLKAAAMPRQRTHVLLPVPGMKETEIYAPNYRDGEKLVLIRHPHAGPFEIPELTNNKNHTQAKRILGGALDAVGISPKTAAKLSGADFDGDTVLVIPNNVKGKTIKTAPALEGLKNFDPKRAYPGYDGMTVLSKQRTQDEMGKISNLITDMSIKGANNTELARAVRHSMVIIDANKHKLNYKLSAEKNGIDALKKLYQAKDDPSKPAGGASTLISRASSEKRVLARKPRSAADGGPIDPVTGKKVYTPTGSSYTVTTKTGKQVTKFRTMPSTKMVETDNAFTLSSGQKMEVVYATYANTMKSMANAARKAALVTPPAKYSPSANKTYAKEAASLKAKLNIAYKNAPYERAAQVLGNEVFRQKKASNPGMTSEEEKKVRYQALTEARLRMGAGKQAVVISDKEWTAIQSGAISNHMLTEIMKNVDDDRLKALATPRTTILMTANKQARANTLLNAGHTRAEVADALGVSISTLNNSLK